MKIKSHLLSGAGNTFHVSFGQGSEKEDIRKKISTEVCRKSPADGFIFLQEKENGFRWDFYNSDGSRAEMCGNATRCIGFYARNILNSSAAAWLLETKAGEILIEAVTEELFKVTMTPILVGESEHGFFADTGVPHLVVEKPDFVADAQLLEVAKKIRNHPDFQPKGTNVTFVSLESEKGRLKALSFERGVEGFTAACGTGAAAAAAYNLKFRGAVQTEVEMPGGTLIMDLSNFEKPVMTGPATLLGSYEYDIST